MADVISGIKSPDSKIAREAAELVRQRETEMFNHSVRIAEPVAFISVKCGRAAHAASTE